MGIGDVTRDDVLKTLEEYDDLGKEAFLAHYGYQRARSYLLVHNGLRYDSKAIVGVAHRHVDGRALGSGDFSGGAATVVAASTVLGFHVEGPQTNEAARPSLGARLLVSPAFGKAESRRHWGHTWAWTAPFTEPKYADNLADDELSKLRRSAPRWPSPLLGSYSKP